MAADSAAIFLLFILVVGGLLSTMFVVSIA